MEAIPAPPPDPVVRHPAALMADALSVMVDAVVGVDRAMAGMAGVRARVVDEIRVAAEAADWEGTARSRDIARMSIVAELACALRIPERTADVLMEHSRALVHELPATLAALERGEIGYRHAQLMIDHTRTLTPEGTAALEQEVLPGAGAVTAAQFDRRTRRVRERLHPESITARRIRSEAERAAFLANERDGMATLSLYLTAPDAHSVFTRITGAAASLQGPGEHRTLTQLRADVARDLLLDNPGFAEAAGTAGKGGHGNRAKSRSTGKPGRPGRGRFAGTRPDVFVTVPLGTAMGVTDEPGDLAGYGPIDPVTAREVAGRARSWRRILVHPDTGVVLDVGRTRYRPPAALRDWLRLRDGTCRFPGCSAPAVHSDIDHTESWESGGKTAHDNLAHGGLPSSRTQQPGKPDQRSLHSRPYPARQLPRSAHR